MLNFSIATCQVQNNDILYISDNSSVFMSNTVGSFTFGSTTSSKTTRTALTYGTLVFASGVTAINASDSHYLDGYARTEGTLPFIMPVGQTGVYAPVKVTPTTADGVDAAYYRLNPSTIGSVFDSSIINISNVEYWDVKGAIADATISLSWRASSNVSTLTNSTLASLTIAGWNGSTWIEIPATVDTSSFLGTASTLVSGSITSNAIVDLNSYSAYTLAFKGNGCTLITSSGNTKTWDGSSWFPSAPDIKDNVIINGTYAGNLTCNSLQLNANITLADDEAVEVIYGITGLGKIIMSSDASVVQRASNVAVPTLQLNKRTRTLLRNDYTYFGTPITGDFFSQLANAKAEGGTLNHALYHMYKFVSGPGGDWATLTQIKTGNGFIASVNDQPPFTNSYTGVVNVPLNGIANNGDITVGVLNDPADSEANGNYNLLGNPYPSAINAEKFLEDNMNVDGVIYLWRAQTPASAGTSTGYYNEADYITYTKAGTVNPAPSLGSFNGNIASGQGFMVRALGSGDATFTNCMRVAGDNNQFNRSTNHVADRFKLNMSGTNGAFSQILIGYYPEATLGYDRMYDALRNSVSSIQLFSILDSDNSKQLAINARPTFVDSDIVPLGVSKDSTSPETFTISIQDKEGVFNSSDVNVYLHDKFLQAYHNFANGDYTFTTNSVSLLNRFEIVYQENPLGNPSFSDINVIASINNFHLTINASSEIESVQIFDITGRSIEKLLANNQKDLYKPFYHEEGIYIAKIKFSNGSISTQKLINKL